MIYLIMNALCGMLYSKTLQGIERLVHPCILMALAIRLLIFKRCVENYIVRENLGVLTVAYLKFHK